MALYTATFLHLVKVEMMQRDLTEVYVRKLPPVSSPVRDDMDLDRELRCSFIKVQDQVASECATMDKAVVPHVVEKNTGRFSGTQKEKEPVSPGAGGSKESHRSDEGHSP